MAKANIWTYTKVDFDKVKNFAESNHFARLENSIYDLKGRDYVMCEYKGNSTSLRIVAAYALALEHIVKESIDVYMYTDIIKDK